MAIPHTITGLTDTLTAAPTWAKAAGAAAALAAAGILATGIHRVRTRIREAGRAKNISALVTIAALIATTVQASGMWKFFGATMGLPVGFRIFMFSFMEIALLACGLRARGNVEEGNDAGIDGILVWVLAMASGVMSSTDAHTLQEGLMRVLTSFVVALLWSRDLMAAKKAARAAAGGKKKSGPVRWRITPERIAVWLRLADAVDTDVSTVDAARRVGKFLRQKRRETEGFQWPFTAKSRAYRGQMQLVDEALRHGDPTRILHQLSEASFADALDLLGIKQTGPDQTDCRADRTDAVVSNLLDRPAQTGQTVRANHPGPDRTIGPDQILPAGPDQTGPANQTGPDRTNDQTDRTDGPADRTGPMSQTSGPDRTGPDEQTGPEQTDRTTRTGRTGPANQTASRRTASNGTDLKVLEVACRAWAKDNHVDPAQMSRRQVLEVIRSVGLTCSNERAGKVLLLLDPKGAVAWMSEAMADQTDRTDQAEMAGPR